MTPYTSILALDSEAAYARQGITRRHSPLRGERLTGSIRPRSARSRRRYAGLETAAGCESKGGARRDRARREPPAPGAAGDIPLAGQRPGAARRSRPRRPPPWPRRRRRRPRRTIRARLRSHRSAANACARPRSRGPGRCAEDRRRRRRAYEPRRTSAGAARPRRSFRRRSRAAEPRTESARGQGPRREDTRSRRRTPPPQQAMTIPVLSRRPARHLQRRREPPARRAHRALEAAPDAGEAGGRDRGAIRRGARGLRAARLARRGGAARPRPAAPRRPRTARRRSSRYLASEPDAQRYVARAILRRTVDTRLAAAVARVLFGGKVDWAKRRPRARGHQQSPTSARRTCAR